jgi:hypothetical protein
MSPGKFFGRQMQNERNNIFLGAGRLYRKLCRLFDYVPLTWSGFVLSLVLGLAVYYRGVAELDMVALAAGGALLVVQVLAIVVVVAATLILKTRLSEREQPTFLELVSGRETHSGFTIPFWFYVPMIRIHWTVKEFQAETSIERHKGLLREVLTCDRRGLTSGLTRRFTISDTLGLASLSWEQHREGRVRALPHAGRLEQPDILLSLVSGEDISDPRGDPQGDRVDMRQYQKGDPMKFILWKVYSRSGKVMVRVPERALAARPRACCYLLSGQRDEPTAAIARVLIELDMLGEEWRFGANGRDRDAVQKDDALNLLAESGNETSPDCRDLQRFLEEAEKGGYGFCLVLAPPGSKRLAEDVFDLLARSGMNSEIWIGLDAGVEPKNRWLAALQALEAKESTPREIHDRWKGRATLVERSSGRVMARTSGARR